MINKLFLYLFVILSPILVFAEPNDSNSKPQEANSTKIDESVFLDALAKDNTLIQNSDFLYNTGTYYLENNQSSLASIYFLKSISLNPLQKDVFTNLALAKAKIKQDISLPFSFYSSIPEVLFYLPFTSLLTIPLILLSLTFCAKFALKENQTLIKILFAVTIVVTVSLLSFSYMSNNPILGATEANELRAGPGKNYPVTVNISTGSLVALEERRAEWIKISFFNNQDSQIYGWAESKFFLPIR